MADVEGAASTNIKVNHLFSDKFKKVVTGYTAA